MLRPTYLQVKSQILFTMQQNAVKLEQCFAEACTRVEGHRQPANSDGEEK